nr:unnamed protein product [Callosobruchus chinensis]
MLGYALYLKPRTIIVRSSVCSKRNIFLTLHFPCPLRETSTLLSEGSQYQLPSKKSKRSRTEGLCSPPHNSPEAQRWQGHAFGSGGSAKDRTIPASI